MKRNNTKGSGTGKKVQNKLPIAIQGYEGSFHQVAARIFFGKDVAILPCASFVDLIKRSIQQEKNRWWCDGH